MPTGDLGLWVSLIEYIGGVFCVFIISDNPHGKDRAEFDFRLALGIFMLTVVGLILLYSTLDTLAYSESRSAIKLSPIALFVSGVAVVLSYRRLKRFEQEEITPMFLIPFSLSLIMKLEKRRFPEENTEKKLTRYYGVFKGENLSAEEIDKLIEEETEKLLKMEL